jgi:hypothetical protein
MEPMKRNNDQAVNANAGTDKSKTHLLKAQQISVLVLNSQNGLRKYSYSVL